MNMILLLIGFVGLLAVGAPIMVAMGLPAIIYYIVSGTSLSLVAYSFYQSTMSFSLLAVPAFILMGNLVSELGETARAFDFARALAKGKRGYSSRIAVVLSLIFAGMSGAAIAGVCGLGPIFVDSMEEEGMRGITERRLRLRPPPLVLSFRPVYRSFCMRRLHRFPASSLCWGAWDPAS